MGSIVKSARYYQAIKRPNMFSYAERLFCPEILTKKRLYFPFVSSLFFYWFMQLGNPGVYKTATKVSTATESKAPRPKESTTCRPSIGAQFNGIGKWHKQKKSPFIALLYLSASSWPENDLSLTASQFGLKSQFQAIRNQTNKAEQ